MKLRARDTMQWATVGPTGQGRDADVLLDTPTLPAPGQACVLYDATRVLGGGFICRTPTPR